MAVVRLRRRNLGDADPKHAAGQGADDDGGNWYTIRPSGQIVGR